MNDATPGRLQVTWFDGRSPKARPATIWLFAGQLYIEPLAVQETPQATGFATPQGSTVQTWPVNKVQWPERQRHGQRQALLPGGGVLMHEDGVVWDAWAQGSGLQDSHTVRWMQSWSRVGGALVITLVAVAGIWAWGVPWVAEKAVMLVPASIEEDMGKGFLETLDEEMLAPSALSQEKQNTIRKNFAEAHAVAAKTAFAEDGGQPEQISYRLHFRAADALGPNAFALPGGDVVLTDALVEMLSDHPDAITGILAHELGHVRRRHGLRMVVQGGIVASVAGLVIGDYSSLLALVPTVLANSAYSRDFEREADLDARTTLRAAGIPTRSMAVFFERIAERHRDSEPSPLEIAIASHPADAERIAFFGE